MEAHEADHLARFDRLLTERRVRPTALAPVWRLAGFALGAGTALLGEKAAHACTEAVETVIEQHYAGQVEELGELEPELAAELIRFRGEEIAHRDQAVAEGAREAPGYRLLSAVIGAGCRAAIKISEKL
jgi:ubiquinone biosynthesis monooxygenase Coq7